MHMCDHDMTAEFQHCTYTVLFYTRPSYNKAISLDIMPYDPNGGPSPIPYGFGGRTGMGMGIMTGEDDAAIAAAD